MPNKQNTRTQRKQSKPNVMRNGHDFPVAAPCSWAPRVSGTEFKAYYAQSGNFQLYHNVPAPYYNVSNLLDSIVNGNNYGTRVGNQICVKELELYLVLNTKADRPNVSYRVMVCAAPSTTSTDSAAELFAGGGITGIHHITNSELLSDVSFPKNQGSNMEANASNRERSTVYRVKVPINKHVVYNTDNTCSTRLIAFVVAYDAYGTLQTDNIASVAQTSWRIVFTDD